jgi:cyanate permease
MTAVYVFLVLWLLQHAKKSSFLDHQVKEEMKRTLFERALAWAPLDLVLGLFLCCCLTSSNHSIPSLIAKSSVRKRAHSSY